MVVRANGYMTVIESLARYRVKAAVAEQRRAYTHSWTSIKRATYKPLIQLEPCLHDTAKGSRTGRQSVVAYLLELK